MHARANFPPASAPGGYVWESEHDIVEVPDALGNDLIRIAGQFTEVLPTDPAHPHFTEPELQDGDEELEPVEDHEDEVVVEQCTATKADGTRCKAKPVPGQQVCTWHGGTK
jgi:hypothetical protein